MFVLFVVAATETKAIAEGLTPRQLCDKYNAVHIEVYKWFDVAFDYFGRTSTDEQTRIAQVRVVLSLLVVCLTSCTHR